MQQQELLKEICSSIVFYIKLNYRNRNDRKSSLQRIYNKEKILLILLKNGINSNNEIAHKELEETTNHSLEAYHSFYILMNYGATINVEDDYARKIIHDYNELLEQFPPIIPIKKGINQYQLLGKIYQDAFAFELEVARVKENNQWFLINRNGEKVSEEFDSIAHFRSKKLNELVIVKQNNQYNFINKKGEILFEEYLDEVNWFENGFAIVKKDGKYGIAKENGQMATKFRYKSIIELDFCKYCKKKYRKTATVITFDNIEKEIKLK